MSTFDAKSIESIAIQPSSSPTGSKGMDPATPSSGRKREGNGPPATQSKMARMDGISPGSLQTPDARQNLSTPLYGNRKNSGDVVSSHKGESVPEGAHTSLVPDRTLEITHYMSANGESPAVGVQESYRCMFTNPEQRAAGLDRSFVAMQDQIFKHALSAEALDMRKAVGVPSQDTVVCIGRVCCDADGKLNKASVLLEGGTEDGGHRVKLNLNELTSYALFPGQYVAVEGVNSSGGRMVARKLCEGVPRPLAMTPNETLMASPTNKAPVRMMVASGPFCCSDNLEYAPLADLFHRATEVSPVEVLVLCGPFIDVHHPAVARGATELESDDGVMESVDFATLFNLRISGMIEDLYVRSPDCRLQIVLVPSLNDAHHDMVYPQPPLRDRVPGGGEPSPFFDEERLFTLGIPFTSGPDKRVHLVSNPSLIQLNELTVAISSADLLFHLGREEIAQNPVSNHRMTRLAEHMIMQQSLYPLFPASGNDPAPIDMRFNDQWRLPVSPDILITPSKLATFAKPLRNGTLAINPGQLARGTGGGTFADLTIFPMKEGDLASGQESRHKVCERTEAKICRV